MNVVPSNVTHLAGYKIIPMLLKQFWKPVIICNTRAMLKNEFKKKKAIALYLGESQSVGPN